MKKHGTGNWGHGIAELALACASCTAFAQAQVVVTPSASMVVNGLMGVAQPPGEKDTSDNFDRYRIGYALWDTGEGEGGYYAQIASLAEQAQVPGWTNAEFARLNPCWSASDLVQLGMKMFQNSEARFDYVTAPGTPNDLQRFAAADKANFVSLQNTVFSPHAGSTCDPLLFSTTDYTGALTQLFPALPAGAKVTQNIGFANNSGFANCEFDYANAHPLVRVPGAVALPCGGGAPLPCTHDCSFPCTSCGLAGAAGCESGLTSESTFQHTCIAGWLVHFYTSLLLPVPSMLSMDSACQLRADIEKRVTALAAFGPDFLDYNSIGGEFFLFYDEPTMHCSSTGSLSAHRSALRQTDYSIDSMAHFRAWLARLYAGNFSALETAWGLTPGGSGGCTNFACTLLDPLAIEFYATNLQKVRDDWRAFQHEQFELEAYDFQYAAAKNAAPEQMSYDLKFGPRGAENGALRSDGVSLGNWYADNDDADCGAAHAYPSTTSMKLSALHGITYGESVNFPIFGMPRSVTSSLQCFDLPGFPPGESCSTDPNSVNWSTGYQPPCFDAPFVLRQGNEFLALGVDSLGLGYFENLACWNLADNDFASASQSLVKDLAQQADDARKGRALTTPWRAPLLVYALRGLSDEVPEPYEGEYAKHAGLMIESARVPLTWLAEQQVQFAPFGVEEGFEDLWVPSKREALLVPFAPGLDWAELVILQGKAKAMQCTLFVAIDGEQDAGLVPALVTAAAPCSTSSTSSYDVYELAYNGGPCGTTVVFDFRGAAAATVKSDFQGALLTRIESACTRPLRPVTAKSSGSLVPGVDVCVASDGLNYLVSLANWTCTATPALDVEVNAAPGSFLAGWPSIAQPSLAAGASVLIEIPCQLTSAPTQASVHQLFVGQKTLVAARKTGGYDVRAAEALLAQMDELEALASYPLEKMLAGLVRLKRMPFVRYDAPTSKVYVVDVSGAGIRNATVHLEFVLQHRHRVPVIPKTVANGSVTASLARPLDPEAKPWDFATQTYALPSVNLVEIHAQHPTYGSQGVALVVGP